jgi:ribosomal protein S12 methylthiotransferase accessory factor YcaO
MTGPAQRDGAPDAPKKHRAGTHRLVSPEETLESVRRFFPAMGITRVADITGLDIIGLPVVTVSRPNSRAVTVSLGKGLDLAAAKASGVMESIEAFMAERLTQPLVLGSVSDLRSSHPLVDVDLLPRTTDSVYHPDAPILWIEGRELFTGTPRWVPYEMVHTAYTLPRPIGIPAFICRIAERRRPPVVTADDAEGMGCHPDRNVALLRALTEAAQSRLGFISGARDDPSGWDHADGTDQEPSTAHGMAGEAVRDFTAVPMFDGDSLDADVAWELAALRSVGISEVVAVDLTHEDFGIPVVRVIVPGLEGPTTTVPNCRLGQRAAKLIGDR